MKILVVGGAGYIGSCFVDYVISNTSYEVVILDDLSTGYLEAVNPKATFIKGSVLDRQVLKEIFLKHKIDGVFHFAAKLIVPESVKQPAKYWLNNVGGVATLVDVMQEFKVNNFVFSSTAAVYGFPKDIPVSETDQTNPCNPYGSSKLACETILQESKIAYGMNYAVLRYFNVAGASANGLYGLRNKNPTLLIPVINKSLIENSIINVFGNDYENTKDGTCIRDYIHIDDLVSAHIMAFEWMLKNNESAIFNLGTDSGYTVLDVINTTNETLNKIVNFKFAPRRLGDPDRLIASNLRAKQVLGWRPQKTLAEMISSDFKFRNKLY